MRPQLLLIATALAAALALPAGAAAYAWPVEPFDRPHAIRGSFCDPRLSGGGAAFHFGVDIVAPDGTPVYAVISGRVHLNGESISVVAEDGSRTVGFWHIVPEVAQDQHVEPGQRVGTVAAGWGHVHLSERRGGDYVNPLRDGGLTPFVDTTSPTIASIGFSRNNNEVRAARVQGTVDAIVVAYDTPPMRMGAPWDATVLAPALLRWRVLRRDGTTALPWTVGIDFRESLPAQAEYSAVYAPGTLENRAGRPGRYRYLVVAGLDSRVLPDGRYRLEIEAADTRGNSARAGLPFRVANRVP